MYEELVTRLRNAAQWADKGLVITPSVCLEAADAIEELSRAQEQWIEQERNALLKSIPRWIPVTERLPLLNTPVLATDGIEVDISWMYGVPPRWITNYTAIDEDKLTHWMPLPQTPKAEEGE